MALEVSYLVGMALQNTMPWNTLAILLKKLSPTLNEAREIIDILLKELEDLQLSSQKNKKNDIISEENEEHNDPDFSIETKSFSDQKVEDIEVLEFVEERINEDERLVIERTTPDVIDNDSDLANTDFFREDENECHTFVTNDQNNESDFQHVYINEELDSGNSNVTHLYNDMDTFVSNDKTCDIEIETSVSLENFDSIKTKERKILSATEMKKNNVTSNLRSFVCATCQKSFKNASSLSKHKGTHLKESNRKCDSCDKRFNRLGNLKNHERIHTGEKPHECKTCKKRFSQSSTLNKHERRHKS